MDPNSGAAPQPGGYAGVAGAAAGHAVPNAETVGIPAQSQEELEAQAAEAAEMQKAEAEKTMADYGLRQDLLGSEDDDEDEDADADADASGAADGDPGDPADGDDNQTVEVGGDGDASNSRAPQRDPEPEPEEAEDYSAEGWNHDALKSEIDKRNEGREDDDRISKAGSSDELRARLVEDDLVAKAKAEDVED